MVKLPENMRRCEDCATMRPESRVHRRRGAWYCLNREACQKARTELLRILAAEKEVPYRRDHWVDRS